MRQSENNGKAGGEFAAAVVRWQKRNGRHNLPWQENNSPYAVWLSEIMLQQTQVAAVIPYYHRFLRRFPDIPTLARARQDSVLAAWSGLGYYARARNLHEAAKQMHRRGIPDSQDGWQALPGVGKTTAAAIMVFTKQARCAVLDGNIKRVLARVHAVAQPANRPAGDKILWTLADSHLPPRRTIRPYTQGLMDLGALVCRRTFPLCGVCPLATRCRACQQKATAQYPQKTAKRDKPEKRAVMLLVYDGEQVFLQKRPSRGIWGGLWSLPEAATKKALWQKSAAAFGNLAADKTLHFTHEFTHYRLRAAVCCCSSAVCTETPADGKWVKFGNLSRYALPAPLRTLLREFAAGGE